MFSPKDGPLFQDGIVTWFVGMAPSIGIAGAKLSLADRIAGKNPQLRRRLASALRNKLICLSAFTAAGLWLLTARVNADPASFPTRGPWDEYIYAPPSRTLAPVAVNTTHGTVENPQNLLAGKPTRLVGSGSYLTLDFGKEVGGIGTLHFAAASDPNQTVGLAFTESSLYVGTNSDASNGGPGPDGAIYAPASGSGNWTMPADKLRGGFRYLTIFLNSSGWVDLDGVSLYFTASPDMADLRAYPNYFYSNDPLLNRIWYAGAYTVQMDTIKPDQGRVWGPPVSGWENNGVVGVGSSVLVDGAKRDRTVWPGDMGIAVPTAFVSTNDLISTRNSLSTHYQHQNSITGELPFAGPEVNFYGSDTYHMWTLVGTANYYLYSGDRSWLDGIWAQYKAGVTYITNKIDSRGLLYVTGTADWARSDQGGENIEANAILYRVLTTGSTLAQVEGDNALAALYTQKASILKSAANTYLWDPSTGEYRDNPTSSLYPQDGNSLAVWYRLIDSPGKAASISQALTRNWNSYGAQTPEKTGAIGTFPGSMEVQAHFAAADDQIGLELIRREWGYMINNPLSTHSSFWEGYLNDGSFDYSGTYMSHAHGWATGPTSALTFNVLGVSPDETNTHGYHFIPHPGDLTDVEGRLTIPVGPITASWRRDLSSQTFDQQLTAPVDSSGVLGVPTFGHRTRVYINGQLVWNRDHAIHSDAHTDGRYVYIDLQSGGKFHVHSQPADESGNGQ
jgi:Bacterial alpha-L-rhamnosidase 6 hairpin glycosidase domain